MIEDGQLAKSIYLRNMEAMKQVLDLGEFKLGGRDAIDYKYFKRVVMDQFYVPMVDIFMALAKKGILSKCGCGTTVRRGYKDCSLCSGAGFCNSDSFNEWVQENEKLRA